METSRKLGTLISLSFLCFLSGGEGQITSPLMNVEVIQGQKVVLPASYSPTSTDLSSNAVVWNLVGDNSKMVISYSSGQESIPNAEFKGRVGFVNQMPNRDVSLYINNTLESDSGRYLCQVLSPGSPFTKELTLDVKVPPSVPVCKLKGKPALKGNVTLSCSSKSGKPIPLYRWTKASPNQNVFFAPMLNETAGTLKLTNLTSGMSGKYVCNASNTAGTETCYINLEVITATNAGVIAGATVGSVIGFILILLVLIFLWTRRRDTEDDLANDIKEDAQAPKRVSWAKSGTGSLSSKNGTLSSVHTSPLSRDLHHHSNHHYTHHPPSDTASILTATGSTAGYRPRPPADTLPGYNTSATLPHSASNMSAGAGMANAAVGPPSTNGGSLPRPEHGQLQAPQVPRPPPVPTGVTAANISRMGGVPIMVPAQNQAGSLV
ncbi:endothelial cell adhesion molecule a [Alosa sapidissima]|uniref:endothelial cell adhesion molecule a n=1 Tax=Alosa sapidissima TaxID=34773 RepID=UPI001C0925EF|nr:endothelial cell adhesion molecule a [Alosa sapidissima]